MSNLAKGFLLLKIHCISLMHVLIPLIDIIKSYAWPRYHREPDLYKRGRELHCSIFCCPIFQTELNLTHVKYTVLCECNYFTQSTLQAFCRTDTKTRTKNACKATHHTVKQLLPIIQVRHHLYFQILYHIYFCLIHGHL